MNEFETSQESNHWQLQICGLLLNQPIDWSQPTNNYMKLCPAGVTCTPPKTVLFCDYNIHTLHQVLPSVLYILKIYNAYICFIKMWFANPRYLERKNVYIYLIWNVSYGYIYIYVMYLHRFSSSLL